MVERALPGEFARGLVVAGGDVVVEAVVGTVVHMRFVFFAVSLQGLFIRGPAAVYAGIKSGVVEKERGLDLRHIGRWGLATVVWYCRVEVGAHTDGEGVRDASAEAEPDNADFAIAIRMGFELAAAASKSFSIVARSTVPKSLPPASSLPG